MLDLAERIENLAGSLGTINGLNQVNFEIELVGGCLLEKDLALSPEELVKIAAALAMLSKAIGEMRGVTARMLAEAGVIADHVG